jgi:RNA polymerase sigma-70 factor (ECF subfamily)
MKAHSSGERRTDPGSVSTTFLDRLRQQDTEAWQRLDYLFRPVVLNWCLRAKLSEADAQDVCQEVFRAVVKHLNHFQRRKPGDSFRCWLWRITQNKICDHWRKTNPCPKGKGGTTFHEQLENIPDAAPPAISEEESRLLFQRALQLLQGEFGERTWQAFYQVVVEGRPVAEVARELGVKRGTVYVAKSRVLQRLREEFSDILEEINI